MYLHTVCAKKLRKLQTKVVGSHLRYNREIGGRLFSFWILYKMVNLNLKTAIKLHNKKIIESYVYLTPFINYIN